MSPVHILTESIGTLWYLTYGIIAGWGLTFTLAVVAIVILSIRSLRQEAKIVKLENRLITLEREVNLTLDRLNSK